MLRFVRATCIAFPQLQDRKVAQGVSARASSIGTAYSKMFSSSKPAAFTLGLLRTANSHHVQATQNDSRNLMNITSDIHIVNTNLPHLTGKMGSDVNFEGYLSKHCHSEAR